MNLRQDNTHDVMVVGSSMVDLISYLEKFPAAGETVFGRSFSMGFGGKGANQAVMAALLGARVSMVNCLATDVFGNLTIENFESFGIDVSRIEQIEDTYSGAAAIWVDRDGENRIVLGAGANELISPEMVDNAFDTLPEPKVVLCQFEIPQPSIVRAFERAHEIGATTILNPAPGGPLDPQLPELTNWLVPNETEFAIIADLAEETTDTKKLSSIAVQTANEMEVNIVVTLGERGALLYTPSTKASVQSIPAPSVAVTDTTGAGDAFAGAFAYAISQGADPNRAAKFACSIAAESVTRPGTQVSYARGEDLTKYRGILVGSSDRSSE